MDTPAQANREKEIDFPDVEPQSTTNFTVHKHDKERQEHWREGVKEGEEKRQQSDKPPHSGSAMDLDNDETIGNP